MEPELRHWIPKDKSPLKSPSFEFHEREACIAWGGDLQHWKELPVIDRAIMTSHYMHRNMRESYISEKTTGGKDKGDTCGIGDLMAAMGC